MQKKKLWSDVMHVYYMRLAVAGTETQQAVT